MFRLAVLFSLMDPLWCYFGITGDVVLVHVSFKKMAQRRDDYGFHCYSELCHFVYCLLSKTRAVGCLPSIHQWDAYMSVEPVKKMVAIPDDLFLVNHPFGEELSQAKMSGAREFRQDCRKFMEQLVEKIHKTVYCSSPVSQGLYAFCPELLFEGDDVIVFDLFAKLVTGLARCGLLSVDEVATSKAEFLSYVVEARRHHSESGVSVGDIKDVRVYLLRQYSFQSRHCLTRVFQLCCLFIELPDEVPTPIEFDFGECSVRPGVLTSCLRSVQSFVSCAGYEQSTFFTETTMDHVRRSLDAAETFMSNVSFNPWGGICVGDKSALFVSLNSAYSTYLQGRVESAESHYKTANVTNRQVFVATPVVEDTTSRASSVEKPVCTASSSKVKDDGGAMVQSIFGGSASGSQREGSLSRRSSRGQSRKVLSKSQKSQKMSTKSTK